MKILGEEWLRVLLNMKQNDMPLPEKLYLDPNLVDWRLYFDREIVDEEAENRRQQGFEVVIYREASDQFILFWFNK